MFDHIGLTVSNLERSRAFYAHALAPLGITELARFANFIGFGREHPQFWIGEGTAVQPAPRTHVAFAAVTRLEVDAFHRAALDAGGADHGNFRRFVIPETAPTHDVYRQLEDWGVDGTVALCWGIDDPAFFPLEKKLEGMQAFADTYLR